MGNNKKDIKKPLTYSKPKLKLFGSLKSMTLGGFTALTPESGGPVGTKKM